MLKPALLAVLVVVVGSGIFHAADIVLLKEFMDTKLSPQPQPMKPKLISDRNVSISAPPPPPPPCPKQVNIAWQLRPPYTLERNQSNGQPNINSIFHQALDFALGKCCAFYRERKPTLRYLNMSSNYSALLRHVFNESISLVFPFNEDQQYILGYSRAYINIIDSPGVVLIQRNPLYSIKKEDHLFKAILGAWPIVVLSLLMSSLAGICIWVLVSLYTR